MSKSLLYCIRINTKKGSKGVGLLSRRREIVVYGAYKKAIFAETSFPNSRNVLFKALTISSWSFYGGEKYAINAYAAKQDVIGTIETVGRFIDFA
jgi:hypothetical protein